MATADQQRQHISVRTQIGMVAVVELGPPDYQLIDKVKETADNLHLDGIHEVAAALRTRSGEVFVGIHIEASVGYADVCGEVAALCNMVSAGHRDLDTIIAAWGDGHGNCVLLPPCGRCRELITDFNPETWVIVGTLEKPYKVRATELLPFKTYDQRR